MTPADRTPAARLIEVVRLLRQPGRQPVRLLGGCDPRRSASGFDLFMAQRDGDFCRIAAHVYQDR